MLLKRPIAFKRGDRGPFIADAQEMLASLGFDPGTPDGVFVSRTEDAVRAFQREYGLEVTGVLDCRTLRTLYDEVDPGGYPAALMEGAAGGAAEGEEGGAGAGEGAGASASVAAAAAGARTIVISVGQRALGIYEGDRLIRRYPVAVGKPSTPTPVGTHRVLEKVMHPGGALGTRWMGFTREMHGIHGTNRPELIGQAVSNGCVRMHNADVEELYDMVEVGTPVAVVVGAVDAWPGLGKPGGPGAGQSAGAAGQPAGGSGFPAGGGAPGPGLGSPGSPQPKDAVGGRTYTVRPGDSLWAIAQRFGTTVAAIVAANNIRNPDLIYPGEVLRIP